MQHPDMKPNLKNNNGYSNNNEHINLSHLDDLRQPGFPGKTYLAHKETINKFRERIKHNFMAMHDIFGALNY